MKQVLLSKAQLLAHRMVSEDPCRMTLQGVHVTEDGETVHATDGHVLVRVTRKNPHENGFPEPAGYAPFPLPRGGVILPAKLLAGAAKALPKRTGIELLKRNALLENLNGEATVLTTDLYTPNRQSSRPLEGPYPRVDGVVPPLDRPGDVKIRVNAKVAADWFKTLAAMIEADGATDSPWVDLSVPKSGLSAIRADWETGDHAGLALLMPLAKPAR